VNLSPDAGRPPRTWLRVLLLVLIGLYSLGLIAGLVGTQNNQWDFRTYYYAGRAYAEGLDPYELGSLAEVSQTEIGFPFFYPPLTLPFFRLLSGLDLGTAAIVFLGLKLLGVAGLIVLWQVVFLDGEHDPLFYLFCIFGFGGALIADLRSGNVSVFEQVALWLAFYALLRNRLLAFSLLVILASVFKLFPVLFLGLLLLSESRRKYWHLLGSGLLFLGVNLASYLLQPQLYSSFLLSAPNLDERGAINPSSLAAIRDVFDGLVRRGLVRDVMAGESIVYLVVIVVVVAFTGWAARRVGSGDPRTIIFLACLAYALILPRFKDYAYILLLVPSYFMVTRVIRLPGTLLLLILLMISSRLPVPFGLEGAVSNLLWAYPSLIMAGGIWALSVWFLSRRGVLPNAVEEPTPGSVDPGRAAPGQGLLTGGGR
jgi:hypothetical protein